MSIALCSARIEKGGGLQSLAKRTKLGHMSCKRTGFCNAILLLGIAFSSPLTALQAERSSADIERGRELFNNYCASCHGEEGKGDGPVARHLKKSPANLTLIQRPGTPFPRGRVAEIIDGEKIVSAHGTRTMPVWGPIFRGEVGYTQAQDDINTLVKYLETLQVYRTSER